MLGGGGAGGKGAAPNLQNAGAASASLTSTHAREVLQKTTAQVAAMKALQASARTIMAPTGIKNGLAVGWLETRDGFKADGTPITSSWGGASITSANNSTTVNVKQTQQSAYLYWKNFNVGPQTKLNFDQSAGGVDVEKWIAFNKVMGNVNPSEIYGSITAQGQVYILNQNGILFHNGAQVNTHALVASSLPINENLAGDHLDGVTASGIANFPNSIPQFLFTALDKGSYDPNDKGNVTVASSLGDVVVEPGAQITTSVDATHSGGLVALVGPNVKNAGSISTPNGQTILAAGLQVGLTPHASSDASLRGMDVFIGSVNDSTIKTRSVENGTDTTGSTGVTENSGLISVPEGDVTLAGATINQLGVIDSRTSVSFNGRIDLLANFDTTVNSRYTTDGNNGPALNYNSTGIVNIGVGSVMRILPDWSSSDTVTGTSLALNSVVSILGKNITMGSGAILDAPGAVATSGALSETGDSLFSGVSLQAGLWQTISQTPKITKLVYNAGDITLAPSAEINVAGSTDILVDSSQNFITPTSFSGNPFQLRGSQLADSPLQQKGAIRGVGLSIDARINGTYTYDGETYYWVGTPLGDATGFLGLIQRTVGQLTEQGGSVSIQAGNSVVMNAGSSINTSGGWTQYSGGKFSTSKLIYQGHLIDISQATPDKVYTGVYTGTDTESSAKWGVTKTFTSPLAPTKKQYEAPYIQGANGGSITIQAPTQILNGSLIGTTVSGPRQLRETTTLSTLPTSSSLTLNLYAQTLLNNVPALITTAAQSVTFASSGYSSESALVLSPDLVSSDGFGNLTVLNHDGTITLPQGASLNAGANGSISLTAANVDIEGNIIAPSGSISIVADIAPYSVLNSISLIAIKDTPISNIVIDKSSGEIVAQRGASGGEMSSIVNADGTISSVPSSQLEQYQGGIVTVGKNAVITTAGTLVNDTPHSSDQNRPVAISGGNITLTGYQVALKKGGLLDVSGGVLVPSSGSLSYGNAGTISLSGGQDAEVIDLHDGSLQLGATLKGYAGAGAYGNTGGSAGTLSITAPAIQIGGSSSVADVLNLSPDFFSQGGFGKFNLTGIGREISGSTDFTPGIAITPGTIIHPQVQSYSLQPSQYGSELIPFTPPAPYRASASLSFTAAGLVGEPTLGAPLLVRGDLIMGAGASITLDTQIVLSGANAAANTGSVSLSGNADAIAGAITVPGGSISITGSKSYPSNDPNPQSAFVTVDLAPTAILSTAGEALFISDPAGTRKHFGSVLSGGSVSVSGNILAEAGSSINASGTSGVYDFYAQQLGIIAGTKAKNIMQPNVADYRVDSSGGSISLAGGQELYSEATLQAKSGGATAAGGSLSVSSGRFYNTTESATEAPNNAINLNLQISQSDYSIPASFIFSGRGAIGQTLPVTGGIDGGGHIAINTFSSGGFDSITLGGNVKFNGPISLTTPGSIKVATGGVLAADSQVNLTASYVALGRAFSPPLSTGSPALTTIFGTLTEPIYALPTFGSGSLNITAQLIDIGNVSIQGIGRVNLNAGSGAIRGDGTFDIAGDLSMTAAEIYPVTQANFTVAAYNHDAVTGAAVTSGGVAGSITVNRSGTESLPLSAGGNLSLYADTITQGGVLLSPFGSINLGTTSSVHDPVSGLSAPTSQNLTLADGSITSVSGLDPITGKSISIPYGTSVDGTSWIDPSGTDISSTGLSGKDIILSAASIATKNGSIIDLRGGGAVTANQWINGNGGTVNLLASGEANYGNQAANGVATAWSPGTSYSKGQQVFYNGSTWTARRDNNDVTLAVGLNWTKLASYYAVIPGYQFNYAPTGYADASIGIGSRITLSGGSGLPAGTYTLLPASYASQPGAYLINASSLSANLSSGVVQPDSSAIVSGTKFNALNSAVTAPKTTTLYQVLSPSVLAAHVDNVALSAKSFFTSLGTTKQPENAGNLHFSATTTLSLNGTVRGQGASGSTGASIDISTPGGIDITQDGTGGIAGDVVLGASQLSSWSFGSLLIGGSRGTKGTNALTPVTVTSDKITMESGATLTGNDIILAANESITLDSGSAIKASGSSAAPDENLALSGDGALIRVSSDHLASDIRSPSTGMTHFAGTGNLAIQSGVSLSGATLILDSSGKFFLDASSSLQPQALAIKAGGIATLIDPTLMAANLDPSDSGSLLLSGAALKGLENSTSLSLTSYSTLDFYGSGSFGSGALSSLGLHAGEIRGFDLGGSTLAIAAKSILLDNASGVADSGPVTITPDGILEFDAATISIGANTMAIDQFAHVSLNATGEVLGTAKGGLSIGTASIPTDLSITTALLTGMAASSLSLNATGVLTLDAPDPGYATTAETAPGLGASLALQGTSVALNSSIDLPSGSVNVKATSGDLILGAQGTALVNVGGTAKTLIDVIKYTDAGKIILSSDLGNVVIAAGSTLNLSAQAGAGSAGTLAISAPTGNFTIDPSATLEANRGTGGKNGTFSLDVGTLPLLAAVTPSLATAGFTEFQSFRVRTGDVAVDDYIQAHHFSLSVDHGSIVVTPNGVINASGVAENGDGILTGGSIALIASGSVTLNPNSELNVHADTYDNAGKGGAVFLSAGAESGGKIDPNAQLDLQTASIIDLGVNAPATSIQDFGGVLHLRAPQTADGTDIQLGHLDSGILGASSIEVEGYRLYDLTPSGGGSAEISSVTAQAQSDAQAFFGSPGVNSTVVNSILSRLTQNMDSATASLVNLAPGVEIINQNGDLTLNQDWDLSSFRTGAKNAPGFLTLRSSGNITLNASLSDGFTSSAYTANLLQQNAALPVNFQSWSYQLTAGSDFTAADSTKVISSVTISGNKPINTPNSVNLGIAIPAGSDISQGPVGKNGDGSSYNYYQVIRTASGDININASGSLQLWNQFSSIYTVGTQVSDPTLGGTFDTPQGNLLASKYPAQYSYAGGNITIDVTQDITHETLNAQGVIVVDSTPELPANWFYRRGSVDLATGIFQTMTYNSSSVPKDIASTTWWVDFSNFFEGVGALGGGNISLNAKGNISNVDAVIPTNYRMSGHAKGSTVAIAPNAVNGVELGGGDLHIQAGNNINAGVYYVENGKGLLQAGGSITTDSTRDPELPLINPQNQASPSTASYLPTTLFLGKGSFNVQAAGDILLGPIANAFLAPQGVNNSFWYTTYFSSYAASDTVNITSLGGDITLRTEAVSPSAPAATPLLSLWMQHFATSVHSSIVQYEPWLALAQKSIDSPTLLSLLPSSLSVAALSGSLSFQGNVTLSPSSAGELSLIASGSINGLSTLGVSSQSVWNASLLNLSDANPNSIPGITSPLSLRSTLPPAKQSNARLNTPDSTLFTASVDGLFNETGSYVGANGTLQNKLTLHDSSLLHAGDTVPVQFYAQNGDISGLTLFSPKKADILAGGDITDIGLYIQNTASSDTSIVSAGGKIVAYDPTSTLQQTAQAIYASEGQSYNAAHYQSGDIQISGPGTLEVLAGGNVDLGNNPGSSDSSLNLGITSIGNNRNPALPSSGADVIVAAGIKLPTGLSSANGLGLENFTTTVLSGSDGATYLSELAATMAYSGDPLSGTITAESFAPNSTQLTSEEKAKLELQLFYIVLRDTGRNHNDASSPGFGSYKAGEEAIAAFFGSSAGSGDIIAWSQNVSTINGGNISLLAPGGGVTLASISSKTTTVAPGIITQGGGNVEVYTQNNVSIGIGRIFTLKGGDILIWSDKGNIAAGASSKTVQSAPPTQVTIDPTSGNVQIDLSGLATGGGIGVLETVVGVPPGNVDLIAPSGVIDAGDAGIRSSGNLNLAATKILNADNIAASGTTAGAPPAAPPPAAPNISGATAGSAAAAANNSAAQNAQTNSNTALPDESPSIIDVEVLGYGGGDGGPTPTTSTDSSIPPQASL